MTTAFLQKKRKLKTNLFKINSSLENDFAPIYYNYSIEKIKGNISKIEEYAWNKGYFHSNLISLRDKKMELNKKFKEKAQILNEKLYLNLFKINHKSSMSNDKEYILHCLNMKDNNIKQIIEINQIRNIPNRKFNLILDIDLTMINAVESNDYKPKKGKTDIEIKGFANKNDFHYFFRYRPYLFNFIKELKDYFNFYISTLSHINYAKKIIDNFKSKANIIIPSCRIIAKNDKNMNTKNYKYIKELIPLSNNKEINDTVIIDDNIYNWLKPFSFDINNIDTSQCIKCLIPSKRYLVDISQNNEVEKYDLLIYNNIYEVGYNKQIHYFFSVDSSYCIEKDSNINNKYLQLYNIEIFLKKCIKFSLFSGISLVEAMNYYRRNIFKNCKFNLKYLSNKWIMVVTSIIKDLGGSFTTHMNETTHFIIENNINSKNIINKNKLQKYVNVNYIFQCYFNLYKCSELDKRFNNIIN